MTRPGRRGRRRRGRRRGRAEAAKKRVALREVAILAVIAMVLYYVMLTFVARPYLIPSESMEPTLHGCAGCVGDRIMVDKLTYRFGSPQPGDVIVFKGPPSWNIGYKSIRSTQHRRALVQNALSFIGFVPPDENDLVKRVIAVGGQTVQCRADTGLTVDGKPLNEPYLDPATMKADPPLYPCLGRRVRPGEGPGRTAMGDGRQPHPFGGLPRSLHQHPGRPRQRRAVHRRPDGGHGAGRQRHRQGQVHRVAAVAMGWCGFGEPPARSVAMATTWPPRTVIRKSSGLRTLESALHRSGLGPVAGVDEVGRGACAGPLVVAACVLGPGPPGKPCRP